MSAPNEKLPFSEQFLRAMNNRRDEDIAGTPEWQEKIVRLADKREASLKRIRNVGLGTLAVGAAIFGLDQAIDIVPHAVAFGAISGGGSIGLGAAIGAQLRLSGH